MTELVQMYRGSSLWDMDEQADMWNALWQTPLTEYQDKYSAEQRRKVDLSYLRFSHGWITLEQFQADEKESVSTYIEKIVRARGYSIVRDDD